MLMTHIPREQVPPAAESGKQVGIPDIRPQPNPEIEVNEDSFSQQFSRCREMLHFIACRILISVDEAEMAVRNCHRTASRDCPQFQNEGAFKSWLVRILIDEATLLLRRKESKSTVSSKPFSEVS
jgi:DNA-directed RNA polymerase specialized sigma24 family protein